MYHREIKRRIEGIKGQIDSLTGNFLTEENDEDFRYELDSACSSLDDAVEVVERDEAYRALKAQAS